MSEPTPRSTVARGVVLGDADLPRDEGRGVDGRIPRSLVLAAAVSWRLLVVGIALYAIVTVFVRLQVILVPAAVAVLLACALWPGVRRLRARGVPPSIAALTMLVGLFGTIGLIGAALVPSAADDIGELDVSVTGGVEVVEGWLTESPFSFPEQQVQSFFDELEAQIRSGSGEIASGALGGAVIAIEVVVGILLTIVLLFFFLKDGDRMWYWLRGFLPESRRARWNAIAVDVRDVLAAFIRGTTIVALVDAVGIGLGLYLLDVPLVIPLALLTFVGGYVPIVGATVAGFVAIMVALVSNGVVTALAVLGVVVGVQQLESNILQPVVVGRSVQLHPAAVLLAVGTGAVLWGVAGALLSVPVTAALTTVLRAIRAQARLDTPGHASLDEP